MIVDKDYPEKSLRWYKRDAVDQVKKDYDYLVQNDAEYFFNEEKTIKDRLSEIRAVGSNDQNHLVCVSKDLVAVHILDFMKWNEVDFDADKYLS